MTFRHLMAIIPINSLLSCAAQSTAPAVVKPALPKSEAECLSRGGEWVFAGPQNIAKYCLLKTTDGGKACKSSSQCESECVEHETGNACADHFSGCFHPTGRGTVTECVN
jgi:hypothetical protein